MTIQAAMLPDGKRLHLQHGPIDLIIQADGPEPQIRLAYEAAQTRFQSILDVLAGELVKLRTLLPKSGRAFDGPVACRMAQAALPYWRQKVTPMVAVAGSVADEMLAAMIAEAALTRAYVNNGGDIALYLADGESFAVASANGHISIRSQDAARGIATSGWTGRSFSFGIADSVTVLAHSAAAADAAATIIANHVDLPDSPKIRRAPAAALVHDSDLGQRRVTVEVARLTDAEVDQALARGVRYARTIKDKGLIIAASLGLNGKVRTLEPAKSVERVKHYA